MIIHDILGVREAIKGSLISALVSIIGLGFIYFIRYLGGNSVGFEIGYNLFFLCTIFLASLAEFYIISEVAKRYANKGRRYLGIIVGLFLGGIGFLASFYIIGLISSLIIPFDELGALIVIYPFIFNLVIGTIIADNICEREFKIK